MSTFLTLYRKELKFLAKPFMILVMIHFVAIVYLLGMVVPEYGDSWSFNSYVEDVRLHFAFLDFIMYGSIFLIPFLLGYSWYEDWSDKTSLQLLSIPEKRSVVAWSKYFAAMTVGLFVPLGIFVYHYLYDLKINPHIGQFPQPFTTHVLFAVFMLCVVFWITGVLSVTSGIITSVRKYQLAIGITVFTGLSVVSWLLTYPVTSALCPANPFEGDVYQSTVNMVRGAVLTGESAVILITGHKLFERYGEV